MKTNTNPTQAFESTYTLLVRSEEKERGVLENVAYFLFILSAVFSIWQAARQPFAVPAGGLTHTSSITQTDIQQHSV
ncbi:MAG: hypothetical protein DLM73_03305 [Chthoniobacterales bacterium]|nr:MAG: hypothetical protein DLM73_03305 [Chthoniobacterales bacterium]